MVEKKKASGSRVGVPAGLRSKGTAIWKQVTTDYVLRADEKALLEQICREVDLIQELHTELNKLPLLMTGSMGQDVVNPLLGEIRQHRALLASLHKNLGLPDLDVDSPGGLEVVPNQNRSAAMSKWGKAHG